MPPPRIPPDWDAHTRTAATAQTPHPRGEEGRALPISTSFSDAYARLHSKPSPDPTRLRTSISMRVRKNHRQAHAGAASTAPPLSSPIRAQSTIGIVGPRFIPISNGINIYTEMRECAVSVFNSISFSTSILNSSYVGIAECTPCLWLRSTRRRHWALQLSASGAGTGAEGRSGAALPDRLRAHRHKTRAEKRRAILIDLAIGLGIPLLQILCATATTSSRSSAASVKPTRPHRHHPLPPPPILIGAISAVYCGTSASTDLLLTVPLASFFLYSNVAITGLGPWISWDDMHNNFSRVRADPYSVASVETLRWATVARALLFFAYFGFADEAIKNSRGGWGIRRRGRRGTQFDLVRLSFVPSPPFLLYSLLSHSATSKSLLSFSQGASATLPVFIRKDTIQKRDSFDSFSDMPALYRSISPLEYEDKEKVLTLGEGDAHALSLADVGGMLPDYNDYSSSAPSSSSDMDSVGGEGEEADIEVSSLHRTSVHIPSLLEPAHV
ncbi:hypothetical protein B0H13DRAFT_2651123 [Mycena leptocephala]|nr:hypothetical protein B0H13DRAFT_2651123 [Mycena leptocephala]